METYYLAIDIGASSGRHILAHMEDGIMKLEEVHRFPNGMMEKGGERCWDYDALFAEIKTGLKKCKELDKIPVSVGVDTWGVDFVLLDEQDHVLGNTVGYRDDRTRGMDEEVYKIIPEDELYARGGIQKAIFNTIYQLMAVKKKHPEYLDKARTFLMVPDYFHYLLSGVKSNEYTEATTSQLIHPKTKEWDMELIRRLGYPTEMFCQVMQPGMVLGGLTQSVQDEVGFNCKVVLPASHDTGSAVLAVPSSISDNMEFFSSIEDISSEDLSTEDLSSEDLSTEDSSLEDFSTEDLFSEDLSSEDISSMEYISSMESLSSKECLSSIYISSGTWSLMGVERMEADCSPLSKAHNFTNEGGYQYRFRYLKNIMGLWMIQSVKKELKEEQGLDLTYDVICEEASRQAIPSLVDCNDDRFLAPESMIREVRAACRESGQPIPESWGEIASVIYNSLAKCYGDTVEEIQEMTGKTYDSISVVGGGANAEYLNRLTARYTKRTVYAGPTEATAIGNLIVQMITNGELKDISSARECIFWSFSIKTYQN